MATPVRGLANQTPATPGTSINALGHLISGGYVSNPSTALSVLYVDPTGPASTAANGTTMGLVPGQTFYAIPNSTLPVSVASTEASHQFVAVQWA
jgi:hypothetical protein